MRNFLGHTLCGVVIFLAGSIGRAGAQETPDPSASRPETGDSGGRANQGEEVTKPGGLDPLFQPINPANFQKLLDRAFGFDTSDRSSKPKVPEIGEPLFFDLTRPLGDLKYGNELNYLLNPSTKNAPTLQVIEYEYSLADWNSAELDLSYYNGRLEILTPFYQRTLGVGKRGNWVHGLQVSPDIYTNSRFVGGSAVYIVGWKPEPESKFSSLFYAGANRALIGSFHFPQAGPSPFRSIGAAAPSTGGQPDDKTYGAWRPTINYDLFYKINEKTTFGIENDFFIGHGRSGEYFSFPLVTYETGKHAFFQVGGGYYHFESRDQFTFLLHLNFVNPSPRKVREEKVEDRREAERSTDEADAEQPSRLRRWLSRLGGDR